MASKPIKLHWSASKPNFGDALSPLVCEAVSGRKIVYADINRCDLVAIGSLLQRLPHGFFSRALHVWGSGYIAPQAPVRHKHTVHAARGALSAEILLKENCVLGDPGLLADCINYRKSSEKKFALGVVSHYKDKNNPYARKLIETIANSCEIDIFLPPFEFLEKLQQCEVILSSAMHGLIAADSLGIPNHWIKFSDELRGGDFKFRDYYSAFNLQQVQPLKPQIESIGARTLQDIANAYYRPGIDVVKEQLQQCFPQSL